MRKHPTAILLGLVVVGLVAVLIGRSKGRAAKAAPDVTAMEIDQLRATIDDLHKEVAVNRMLLASQAQPVPSTDTAPGAAPAAPPPPAAVARKGELTEVGIIAQLDDIFKTQETDAAWSRSAVSTGSRILGSHLTPGSRLASAECRKDLCRFETRHPGIEDYQQFFRTGLLSQESGLWSAGFTSYVIERSPAGVVAVTFVAKEGQAVPNTVEVPTE